MVVLVLDDAHPEEERQGFVRTIGCAFLQHGGEAVLPEAQAMGHEGPLVLPHADDHHLVDPALDLVVEIAMGLDPVDDDDLIGLRADVGVDIDGRPESVPTDPPLPPWKRRSAPRHIPR